MIEDVISMYSFRLTQFNHLRHAVNNFNQKNEKGMWDCLFMYAESKAEAAEIFNSFTDEDLDLLMGKHGMKLVVSRQDM